MPNNYDDPQEINLEIELNYSSPSKKCISSGCICRGTLSSGSYDHLFYGLASGAICSGPVDMPKNSKYMEGLYKQFSRMSLAQLQVALQEWLSLHGGTHPLPIKVLRDTLRNFGAKI